ncbi:MAG: ATP-dependent DNA helicase, partial [Prevotella sp.]|nr:ATP-dependent DNA helicase [Prevotella sp.]
MTGEEQKYAALLKQYWGYDSFRGIQLQIIKSICAGRDTLGLMPTGGGKSITFQVPALAQEGVCIVITPLIALMKDQVQHLKARGIRAAAIYSGMTHNEIVQTLEDAVYGGIKLLYVSPERLASDIFQIKLKHMKVSFITVDEAHCISQWGYDFRPSYLQIAQIRDFVPDAPLLALTATATPEVVTDIQHQLKFKTENVFRMSFVRKNLAYVVRETEDKAAQLVHILRSMPGSAIVYVRSRRHSSDIAKMLNEQGVSATFYHAGLEPVVKDMRQDKWQHDKVRVMVATTAFGMGIDKPDVRLVIHTDCPSSPEAYFQEAGRAGRDGKKAYAVLLYNRNDEQKLRKRITDTFPDKQLIRDVYDHLAYFFEVGAGSGNMARFEFNIDKFSVAFKHFPVQVNSAFHILQQAGYIDYETDPDTKARVKFILTREELYRLDRSTGKERAVIDAL